MLDATQLIKHAFGLINSAGPAATLLYMYWKPANASRYALCRRHRDEIEGFAGRVARCWPGFRAMSYPELWAAWSDAGHVRLTDREL